MIGESSRLLLLRHGETQSNLVHRYAGESDEPLTPLGRQQIETAANLIAPTQPSCILTSGIPRAHESALIISKIVGVPVVIERRLNELRMGPWEGLTELEVAARFPDAFSLWQTFPTEVHLPGRETLTELAARVADVATVAAGMGDGVVVVSHVAPLRVLMLQVLGQTLNAYKRVNVPNGALFELWWPAGPVMLLSSTSRTPLTVSADTND